VSSDFGKIGATRLGAQDPTHHAGIRGGLPPSLAGKIKQSQRQQKIFSAAPKLSSSVAATSRTFIEAPRSYVLLSASPDPIWFDSQGFMLVVPPRGEIIPEGDPHFQNSSLYDTATGDYVPGSLVIKDVFTQGEFGEQVLLFDVVFAIKSLLGVDLVSGPLAKRGLSVMPLDASQEMIDALSREGHSRWEVHRIENAKAAVRAEQDKVDRHRKLNLPVPPPSPDVEEQALFLQEVAQRQRARIADILNAEPAAVSDDATKVAGLRAGVLDGIAQPSLQTPIGGTATGTTREALLAALRSDPELRRQIVETAQALEARSAAAQSVIDEAAQAAPARIIPDGGDLPIPAEEPTNLEPNPDEPDDDDDDEDDEHKAEAVAAGPPVTRHRGHPRR
jgi:hypothetical protein